MTTPAAAVVEVDESATEYVLRGTKMHVTSYNTADWIFFQAKLTGGEHEGEHGQHAGRDGRDDPGDEGDAEQEQHHKGC